MKKVTLEDKHFKLFIESKKILAEIDQLSSKINAYYANKKPIFICVLNGAFLFASELIKRFDHECEVSFVKLSSYEGLNSSGVVKNLIGLNENIKEDKIIRESIIQEIVLQAPYDLYKVIYEQNRFISRNHFWNRRYTTEFSFGMQDFIEDIFSIRMILTDNDLEKATKSSATSTLALPADL